MRQIDIVGNIRTRDKVIRREIPIEEDQLYSTPRRFRLLNRGLRGSVFLRITWKSLRSRVPGTEDQLDVKVKVEEKPTGFFSIAGGFSSVETFIFAGQIQEANLFGYGKRLTLNAQIGGVTQLFYVKYQDPHLFDTDLTLDALAVQDGQAVQGF